jgi:histidinol-phosphate aminotransferase
LQQKLGEHLGGLEINRYPGERRKWQMLADYGAPAGTSVLLGGSDEIITLLALATAQPATMPAPRCWRPCRAS